MDFSTEQYHVPVKHTYVQQLQFKNVLNILCA